MSISPKNRSAIVELTQNSEKLIYMRLKEWLEDEILSGSFPENTQIPSVAELSVSFKLNHITVLKSVNMLSEAGILYKKRGIGTFVAEGAAGKIRNERHSEFYQKYIVSMISEAKKLGITADELTEMTERGYHNE